jgi:hypothetical protein
VCRLAALVECVEESEGLRRDGAWEHGVLQQRPAGEAPLHDPPHVCALMHVGAAQARTRGRKERPVQALVLAAMQVREKHAARASYVARLPNLVSVTRIYVDSGKHRGLVRVRHGMPWPARLPYMPLEVMSILHLLTCISTHTGPRCFTLFHSCFTTASYFVTAVILFY